MQSYTHHHIVIMAGGIGSRFWPLSTPEYPKQFIDILGCGKSLIQLTVDRFRGLCPDENFWIVTNQAYIEIVKQQLPSVPESHILAEPAARNTAPCIAWACWAISQEDPDANIVVTPSDAIVMNPEEFRRVAANALAFTAQSSNIVTIGIRPSRPEIGYGYVAMLPEAVAGTEIHPVSQFKEKPSLDVARQYLSAGNYLWNAGIFVWNARTIISSFQQFKPQIARQIAEMVATGDTLTLFPACEKISIDYAVMEPASQKGMVFTHPADFGWSDLGNWASLYDKLEKDSHGNASVGPVRFFDCLDCIVHADDAQQVVLQGLNNYIVSEKGGRFLICQRTEEQQIKQFSSNI